MKLYYAPRTRSGRPRWLLEELGVPYELVTLDLSAGAHKQPAYLAVHPLGVVPALQDGDITIQESGAICLYLADKFVDKKLAPPPGTLARGAYYQWILFATTTLEARLIDAMKAKDTPDADAAKQKFSDAARVVEDALGDPPYLLSHMFTTADVIMGAVVIWASFAHYSDDHPKLRAYGEKLAKRPAYIASRKG